jgi:hypothetical protein
VASVGVKGNAYRIVFGRPFGRLKHSWEETIKLDPEEMEFELDIFDSRQRALADSYEYCDEPPGPQIARNFMTS